MQPNGNKKRSRTITASGEQTAKNRFSGADVATQSDVATSSSAPLTFRFDRRAKSASSFAIDPCGALKAIRLKAEDERSARYVARVVPPKNVGSEERRRRGDTLWWGAVVATHLRLYGDALGLAEAPIISFPVHFSRFFPHAKEKNERKQTARVRQSKSRFMKSGKCKKCKYRFTFTRDYGTRDPV